MIACLLHLRCPHARRGDWVLAILVFCSCRSVVALEPVGASLESESAWTGQAVSLIVTLYSPGPFSDTASFDLPEIAKTIFIKDGNPVVGSEVVEGTTLLTQRHRFKIFTQQVGVVVIPPFDVRFAGKNDFISKAQPVSGSTKELRFESKRPPGSSAGLIVAATDLSVSQEWSPENAAELYPGDVLRRTIVQRASETTALMLQSISAKSPSGVRIYTDQPQVEDRSQRGVTSSTRTDVIKYQFERPGAFQLPDIRIQWFDTSKGEMREESLLGLSLNVNGVPTQSAAATQSISNPTPRNWLPTAWGGLLLVVSLLVTWRYMKYWRKRSKDPEVVAAREVLSACKEDNAIAAYSALLHWQRIVSFREDQNPLDDELRKLSLTIFSSHSDDADWTGGSLRLAFRQSRKKQVRNLAARANPDDLPSLNPGLPMP